MCYAMFQSQVIEFPWADLQEYDVEEEGMVFQFEYRRPNKKHKNVQILTQYVSRAAAVSALNIYKLDIFFKWAGIFLILAQMSLSICVLTLSDVLNVWRQISLIKPTPQNVGGWLYWVRFVASVGRSISNSCPLYNSFINGRISFKLK